jgi:hypothetical protein
VRSEVGVNIRGFRIPSGGLPALLVTTALLAGCVASVAAARPVDFPLHSKAPPVDFYWRLSVTPDAVQADGLVERRNHLIAGAWLQLLGLDATGRIVSFTPPTRVRWNSESDVESFTIPLRPRGGEQRFEVRLYSFEYPEENTP